VAPIHVDHLIATARKGDRRALGRLVSLLEEGRPGGDEVIAALFPDTGRAHLIGITGSPGSGKSTLVDRLLKRLRASGEVAVVAVDPSSPFSGGAILGDRVRMHDGTSDPGVFIRSMSNRGRIGGVAAATAKVVALLDAVGFATVIVETVGVGQAEIEIVDAADTTVVVVNPGWGDSVQAAKAGLLEVGDIFVVNKADRGGVEETARQLTEMVELGDTRLWQPPVVATVATTGEGLDQLAAAVAAHWRHLAEDDRLAVSRRRRLGVELRRAVHDETVRRVTGREEGIDEMEAAVAARAIDPWSAARRLLDGEDG
jgi:LAO/AO transport system kinase